MDFRGYGMAESKGVNTGGVITSHPDNPYLNKIPLKYHCMISKIIPVTDVSFDTGKKKTAYDVTLNDGYVTNDNDTCFTSFSFSELKEYLKYNVHATDCGLSEPAEIIPAESTGVVTADNETLTRHLNTLDGAVNTAKNSFLAICIELCWFNRTRAYLSLSDSYKNIADFAYDRYGLKKAMTYQYIAVAESFGKEDGNGNITDFYDEYKEYGITQLIAMKGMDNELLHRCSTDMKVNDIKKIASGQGVLPVLDTLNAYLKKDAADQQKHDVSGNDTSPNSFDSPDKQDREKNREKEKKSVNTVKRPNAQELYSISTIDELDEKKAEIFESIKKILASDINGMNYSISISMTW